MLDCDYCKAERPRVLRRELIHDETYLDLLWKHKLGGGMNASYVLCADQSTEPEPFDVFRAEILMVRFCHPLLRRTSFEQDPSAAKIEARDKFRAMGRREAAEYLIASEPDVFKEFDLPAMLSELTVRGLSG